MAVEDADALAECLTLQAKGNDTMGQVMIVFEAVRTARAQATKIFEIELGEVGELSIDAVEDSEDSFVKGTTCGIADQEVRDWAYGL
ncbi:hypothetical protein D0Z07_5339 [Hyphodiscus hymeniophilus]|uniref:Uncharacterized protein n=1 Tax=Hyphodiscus hymeniophilus TaxID=353542 RepID=A0A9P7AW79_9HELO|nr:hypothetical protein D0Z07_5339 [Hyphodiscus hymeniophilus]